jgi:hypothetical protein
MVEKIVDYPLRNLEVDTLEKQEAYDQAERALDMRQKNPGSLLWRMRVRQALNRLEKLYGARDAVL